MLYFEFSVRTMLIIHLCLVGAKEHLSYVKDFFVSHALPVRDNKKLEGSQDGLVKLAKGIFHTMDHDQYISWGSYLEGGVHLGFRDGFWHGSAGIE